jgi:hypothetical protein
MDHFNVTFSRKKWKQIYREIDRNFDDEISFEKFFIFLFPSHDFATANEVKRMKHVRKRVKLRQELLNQTKGTILKLPFFDNQNLNQELLLVEGFGDQMAGQYHTENPNILNSASSDEEQGFGRYHRGINATSARLQTVSEDNEVSSMSPPIVD